MNHVRTEDPDSHIRMSPPRQLLFSAVLITIVGSGLGLETDQWGEPHQRAPEAELDTVVVLPSSSGDLTYKLEDLSDTKDWGLVEINSDTDLTQAEVSRFEMDLYYKY